MSPPTSPRTVAVCPLHDKPLDVVRIRDNALEAQTDHVHYDLYVTVSCAPCARSVSFTRSNRAAQIVDWFGAAATDPGVRSSLIGDSLDQLVRNALAMFRRHVEDGWREYDEAKREIQRRADSKANNIVEKGA